MGCEIVFNGRREMSWDGVWMRRSFGKMEVLQVALLGRGGHGKVMTCSRGDFERFLFLFYSSNPLLSLGLDTDR
jgi:hypothetical protein